MLEEEINCMGQIEYAVSNPLQLLRGDGISAHACGMELSLNHISKKM